MAELLHAAEKSKQRTKALEACLTFLEPFEVVAFDDEVAVKYAELRTAVEKKGKALGASTLIIAASVMVHHGILVTHNTKEFERINGLRIEDWVRE